VEEREKCSQRRKPSGVGTCTDVVLVTETEELLNMFLAYIIRGEQGIVGDKP
jgi:hypothetical protein